MIMKKYIYKSLIIFGVTILLASCTANEGTEPGNNETPSVVIYQYKPGESYNEDNDITLRFATNSATSEVYYLSEKSSDKEKKISEMGEMGYTDYVIEQGIKLEGVNGASNVDVTLTGMFGEYTITAVAVNSSQKISSQTVFTGLEWEDVVSGNYIFASQTADGKGVAAKNITGVDSNPVILQVCTTDETLYRFKDVYGTDKNLKINLIDYYGTDNNGDYQFFRVPNTKTPYTYGNFGEVSVCDIGYWQGDESFVTQSGYESGMYTDKTCFIFVAYQVSAGALGYGFDYFIPNE